MTDDGTGGLTGNLLPEDPDMLDALRLADILARVESGHAPDLDQTEDPALWGLLTTATRVHAELGVINDAHAFQSFHTRSRAAILHSLERSATVVPFYRRLSLRRSWRPGIVTPFAAAAAAAAIAISAFGSALLPGGGLPDRGAPEVTAMNLTPHTTDEELDRLAAAIASVQERVQSGQPVPAPLLRAVSEGAARVANTIEQNPERLTKETVATYHQAAQAGQTVLNEVTVEQDAQGALAAAQRAARDGVVVAGRFLTNAGVGTGTASPAPASPAATTLPAAAPAGTTASLASIPPSATVPGSGGPAASSTPSVEPPSDIVR
ncbi:MAG: hypothetical protein EXR68_07175 [Dehalococcoidia bacterium]|nr:hypothetical protein [Dehalococcoidia bacterium]